MVILSTHPVFLKIVSITNQINSHQIFRSVSDEYKDLTTILVLQFYRTGVKLLSFISNLVKKVDIL